MDLTISHRSEFLANVTKVAFIFGPAGAGAERPVEALGVIGASPGAATGFSVVGRIAAGEFALPPVEPASPSIGPSVEPFQVKSPLDLGN